VDAVMQKVDLDALMGRLDMNAIAQRLDIDAIVQQTDLGAIIAKSSGGIAGDALDVVRSQTVGLDEFLARWVARLRRRHYTGPPGPADPPGLPGPAGPPGPPDGQHALEGR
jgi:hypothetical protein